MGITTSPSNRQTGTTTRWPSPPVENTVATSRRTARSRGSCPCASDQFNDFNYEITIRLLPNHHCCNRCCRIACRKPFGGFENPEPRNHVSSRQRWPALSASHRRQRCLGEASG